MKLREGNVLHRSVSHSIWGAVVVGVCDGGDLVIGEWWKRVVCWMGDVCVDGGGVHILPPKERPLKRAVSIPLECILVWQFFFTDHKVGQACQ